MSAPRARRRRPAGHRRAPGPVPGDLRAAPTRRAELRGDRGAPRRVARHRQVADVARNGAPQATADALPRYLQPPRGPPQLPPALVGSYSLVPRGFFPVEPTVMFEDSDL